MEEKENALMRFLHKVYNPFFDAALRSPVRSLFVRLVPILACVVLFPLLGREFMPKLEEGNFWIRATLPMSISLEQSSQYVGRMRDVLRGCDAAAKVPCDEQSGPQVPGGRRRSSRSSAAPTTAPT